MLHICTHSLHGVLGMDNGVIIGWVLATPASKRTTLCKEGTGSIPIFSTPEEALENLPRWDSSGKKSYRVVALVAFDREQITTIINGDEDVHSICS